MFTELCELQVTLYCDLNREIVCFQFWLRHDRKINRQIGSKLCTRDCCVF